MFYLHFFFSVNVSFYFNTDECAYRRSFTYVVDRVRWRKKIIYSKSNIYLPLSFFFISGFSKKSCVLVLNKRVYRIYRGIYGIWFFFHICLSRIRLRGRSSVITVGLNHFGVKHVCLKRNTMKPCSNFYLPHALSTFDHIMFVRFLWISPVFFFF